VDKKYIGVFSILCASLMWAIEPVFAKLSYETADFLETSAIRALFAALTALFYVVITNKSKLAIKKHQVPTVWYIAVVGTLFADLMYFFALNQVPVINAVVIGHMQPIFIIVFALVFLKGDRLSLIDYLGIVLMMISALLVTTRSLDHLFSYQFGTIGDVLVLSATIAWATTAIAMRRYLKDVHAGVITFYRFSIASLFLVIYLLFTTNLSINNGYQILLGFIVGLGTILYYEGLKRLKAAQVSGLELSTPFFAAILAFFILGELVTLLQLVGIVLLLVGIYLLSKKEKPIQG